MDYSVWRGKHKTLKEYYAKEFDPTYFSFNKYELEIDPDESKEQVEAYDTNRQTIEIIKCENSFEYFCHKYVKILHPKYGLIPFILYNYQRKVIKDYENNRFNIVCKFRQGGLTTVTLLWGMWRCMFQLNQQVMLLSKTDREATIIGLIVDRAIGDMPEWIKPKKNDKWNDHMKQFSDTGGLLQFYSPEAARGKSAIFLIVDEAAFITDMDKHWKAMWPVISTGGNVAIVSTVNGLGNWYEETYTSAKLGKNKLWNVIDLDYVMHPDYNNEEWVKEQQTQLGEKGWRQEVLHEFLGSGETYFDYKIIKRLDELTLETPPVRKLFRKWANTDSYLDKIVTNQEWDKGALWVWREPIDGHEYLLAADCAEGQGEKTDNSCFEIIDSATLEQVAEFYSNTVPPHVFAQIINEVGIYYNNALVIVENMAPGGAVLSNLQHHLSYDNLYYESKKGSEKAGLTTNRINRPLFIEALQNRLINDSVRVNSKRFVNELKTFLFNSVTKKAEAIKGKHDDAIMAMSLALYVRDSMLRDIPVGAEMPREIIATFKTRIYEEIKLELKKGIPENLIEEEPDLLEPNPGAILPGVIFNEKKANLMKEFGWWR